MPKSSPEVRSKPVGTPKPLSLENAKALLCKALTLGRTVVTSHFKRRAIERGFTAILAERVIRHGSIISAPIWEPKLQTFKYELAWAVDDRELRIIVALCANCDYYESPRIILITGFFKI